jgi:hypothetical protein
MATLQARSMAFHSISSLIPRWTTLLHILWMFLSLSTIAPIGRVASRSAGDLEAVWPGSTMGGGRARRVDRSRAGFGR